MKFLLPPTSPSWSTASENRRVQGQISGLTSPGIGRLYVISDENIVYRTKNTLSGRIDIGKGRKYHA